MKRVLKIIGLILIAILVASCKKKVEETYSISFDLDGGTIDGELIEEFKVSDNYSLPNPTKEDYLFIGWIDSDNSENEYFVTKLEGRNYNLKAYYTERFEYSTIKEDEIFNRTEENYLVYFYRDNCSWCNKIKDGVLAYLYKQTLPQFSGSRKVYALNLTEGGSKASIFRTYNEDNGDGDGSFKATGLTDISEMYISSTPALIEITNIDGIKTAKFLETGATKVLNEINRGLKSSENVSNKQYTICLNSNGGELSGQSIIYFYDASTVSLPTPTKEDEIFVGWTDGNKFIDNIENKDYELSASWIRNEEYRTIKEEDIFNQNEESYFVYIYRDGCSWCKKISDRVKAYIYKTTLANYSYSMKVFPLNLTEGGSKASIFRSYDGDDGEYNDGKFKVTGLTSIDEMYISSTPALIRIDIIDGVRTAKFVAGGATNVINAIEKELVYKEGSTKKNYFNIEYILNGGTFKNEPSSIFYSWEKVPLPIPEKNGYVFIGWYENEIEVKELEERDYVLEARYMEYYLPSEIMASDLYQLSYSTYYVCFIKDDLSYYDELVKTLTLFSINVDENIFVINIDKDENKVIKRSYTGEGGQSDTGRFFVNGVTSIDDLYIPKAAALIKISEISGVKTSEYLESGEDVIKYINNLIGR